MSLLTLVHGIPTQAAEAAPLDVPLMRYVQEALLNNPGLRSASLDTEAERQRLENLRARYYPSLSLQARATVSEGGRTIDFPAGDLLNPVYQTLNAQLVMNGQAPRFPTIQNQSIPLLRPTEQDTRLQLRGPIYEPVLNGQVKAQTEVFNAQQAAQLQVREELVRDLQVSYWQLAQAQARIDVLRKSLTTLEENRRVNQQLYKAGETTLDAPRRAEAEVLDIQVQLKDAEKQARLARDYFNLLRFAPTASPVDMPVFNDDDASIEQLLNELQPREPGAAAAPALTRLERSLAAQQAAIEAASATYKPTLGYQIEGGYQGRDYQTGPKTGFASASVVLSWTLADGGVRSSDVLRAKAQADALQARAAQLSRQLQLAKTQATENLLVSLDSIAARTAQRKAADESLRIVSKKRDAGEATPIEFLSSEQAATRARLGLIAAVYQVRIDHAVWQFNNRDIPDYALPQGVQP
ncbi:TolC family protein [Limnobacter humi]|uniref:TolC family protein n=1 Tax=Limnobacter humi TaxID=1778671 RepID=A0ABT1WCH6_9BURK|nr:TolC family protein [Limnobacter humi]MCQ8895079.1 TolC family protein [Limnobacter humi]